MTESKRKEIKYFLSLYSYADDDKKKTESINYIMEILQQAEEQNKVLEFTKMEDIEFSPNPILDHDGKLLFNTKTLIEAFNEYNIKVKFVKTEVAKIVRESYLIMKDTAALPLQDINEKK